MKKSNRTTTLILMSVFATGFIFNACSSPGTNKPETSDISNVNERNDELVNTPDSLKIKLDRFAKQAKEDGRLNKNPNTAQELVLELQYIQPSKALIQAAENSGDKAVMEALAKYKEAVKSNQFKNFPLLRKAYAKIMQEGLWEHDIDVTIGGKNNDVLTFTGVVYATNKNVKSHFEAGREGYANYRFKEIRYKWIRHDDEFTYFTINSPKDTALIID